MSSYKSIKHTNSYKSNDDTDIDGIFDQSMLQLPQKFTETKFACKSEMMTIKLHTAIELLNGLHHPLIQKHVCFHLK